MYSPVVDESISKAELRLTDIAEAVQGDWTDLARQLNISEDEIMKIQSEYPYVSEQALVMMHLWVQKNRNKATGRPFYHVFIIYLCKYYSKLVRNFISAFRIMPGEIWLPMLSELFA